MTLGFNVNRRHPRTNLAGAVGANVVSVQKLLRSRAQRSPGVEPRVAPHRSSEGPERGSTAVAGVKALPSINSLPPPPIKPSPATMVAAKEARPVDRDAIEWVYATATVDLLDQDTRDVVCRAGERALLVYPMRACDEEGTVRMRLKRAHPHTGQLHYHWVDVYDPNHDVRFLSSFSLVA